MDVALLRQRTESGLSAPELEFFDKLIGIDPLGKVVGFSPRARVFWR